MGDTYQPVQLEDALGHTAVRVGMHPVPTLDIVLPLTAVPATIRVVEGAGAVAKALPHTRGTWRMWVNTKAPTPVLSRLEHKWPASTIAQHRGVHVSASDMQIHELPHKSKTAAAIARSMGFPWLQHGPLPHLAELPLVLVLGLGLAARTQATANAMRIGQDTATRKRFGTLQK